MRAVTLKQIDRNLPLAEVFTMEQLLGQSVGEERFRTLLLGAFAGLAVLLACFGVFWVVGPYTVFVLPLTLLVNWILYHYQRRQVFGPMGLRVRSNRWGFLLYVLAYQMVMSPVAVLGYGQELLGLRRRWK